MQVLDGGGAVTFAQPRVVAAENGGQVCESRERPAERFVDKNLLRRVGQVIITADDVSNLHQGIVDNDGIVVGWQAV